MCGIAGHIAEKLTQSKHNAALESMRHRGPDAQGEWTGEQAWLGHTRLSIIDLSIAANQPMHSACNRYVMVYNGEVYNHPELRKQYLQRSQLKTQSDSEVLLELFAKMGAKCLPLLQGMFSLAIFDKHSGDLFAARDRFGVKPFYYTVEADGFKFASEIKVLWKMGVARIPSVSAWSSYFQQGTYADAETTFWENVLQLPGGHCLHFNAHTNIIQVRKWYSFEEAVSECHCNKEDEWLERYTTLVSESIALRLRSDVPTGINLSGGIDSQMLLAGTIRHTGQKVCHAFTFFTNHSDYDEWTDAEKFAKSFPQVRHHGVLLQSEEVPTLASQMAAHQDEPFGGIPTLAYSKLFDAARKLGVIVVSDGQGGDEACAGYDYYWNNSNHLIQGVGAAAENHSWMEAEFRKEIKPLFIPNHFSSQLQNLQYRDLFVTKLPRALRFNDRASMLYGVELREPLLDHRLVELAFAAPDSFKRKNGFTKFPLWQTAVQWGVRPTAAASKQLVQTPQREWLAFNLRHWATELIHWLAGAGNPGWFQKKELLEAWQQYLSGPKLNSFFVWQWINTSLLLQSDNSSPHPKSGTA